MTGRAKALDARIERVRPKISLLVFMISCSRKLNNWVTRYGAKSTRAGIKEKLTRLLANIAKNDSWLQRPVLKRFSRICSALGRFLAGKANSPLDCRLYFVVWNFSVSEGRLTFRRCRWRDLSSVTEGLKRRKPCEPWPMAGLSLDKIKPGISRAGGKAHR